MAQTKRNLLIALLALLSLHGAAAQELEDSLDAEMDQVSRPAAPAESTQKPEVTEEFKDDAQAAPKEEPPKAEAPAQAAPTDAAPPVARSEGIDEPDFEFERRIYRIFKDAKPVSQEKWAEMIGSRKEDVYVVQAGDTLWDISQTLFGDGFFWSKLWAENGGVENPHRISKGLGVRFVAGNEAEAPSVDVVSTEKAETIRLNAIRVSKGKEPTYREEALKEISPDDLAARNSIEIDELVPQPELPPAAERKPVLRNLPASFVEKSSRRASKYDTTGLDVGVSKSMVTAAVQIPNSIILDSMPAGVGKVDEVEIGDHVASIGQNVFVHLSRPAQTGERFTVIYSKGKIKDPDRNREIGPVVEIGGVIEIVGEADDKKNVYRANVVTCVNPVRVGSVLLEEKVPKVSFSRSGTLLNVDVRVIGGEFDSSRRVIGQSSVVFLDGGSRAGLSAGDMISVLSRRGQRKSESKYPNIERPIALLKIIRVENTVATAMVLEASDEIIPGDHTGGVLPEKQHAINIDDEMPVQKD